MTTEQTPPAVDGPELAAAAELRRSFGLRTLAAGFGLVSTFLLTVLAVRILAPRDAAVLLAVLAALTIGPMLGRLGLGQNVIRLLAAEPDLNRRRAIAGTHLRATLLLAAVTSPVVAALGTAGLLGDAEYFAVAGLTALVIVLESIRLTLSDVFATLADVRWSVATTHHVRSTLALGLVALAAAVLAQPRLTDLLLAYVAAAAILLAAALIRARRDVVIIGRAAGASMRPVIASGVVLFALDLSSFTIGPGTVWLANASFEPADAARYATAAVLAMQIPVLEGLAAIALTPVAARMWAAGRHDDVVRLLTAVATLATVFSLAAVGAVWAFGRAALVVVYGPDMAEAHVPLLILALGGLARTALGVNIILLIISGHIKRAAVVASAVFCAAVPALVLAGITAGPTGLATAAATATAALVLAQWVAARAVVRHPPHADWRIAAAWRTVTGRTAASP